MKIPTLPSNTPILDKIKAIYDYVGSKKYIVVSNGEVIDSIELDESGVTLYTISDGRYYEFSDKSDMADLNGVYFMVAKVKLVIAND